MARQEEPEVAAGALAEGAGAELAGAEEALVDMVVGQPLGQLVMVTRVVE